MRGGLLSSSSEKGKTKKMKIEGGARAREKA
jgi:hypothetical protein